MPIYREYVNTIIPNIYQSHTEATKSIPKSCKPYILKLFYINQRTSTIRHTPRHNSYHRNDTKQ